MEILTFDQLPQGGFAGLKERQFVTDQRVFGNRKNPNAANGIGNFVYLADANFNPKGKTGMHSHREIDVISVMVDGRVSHAGSLEHGQELNAGFAQVQRAGAEGFSHDEINPDDSANHMIQLWVMPDNPGEAAGYKVYEPQSGDVARIYGGSKDQQDTFYSQTLIDVALPTANQTISHQGEVMAFLSQGHGEINGQAIQARTLVRVTDLEFVAHSDSQLILIHQQQH
ncbi:MAG: redox-sensitive bicupin YhaK (pirin superfamily) [Phenylobacterium sp.]|jgi:redox-sensitive bicupin YhaK (pirin superfamily)